MGAGEALHELEALGQFLADLLGAGGAHLLFQLGVELREVDPREEVLDGLRAHAGDEALAVLILRLAILSLREELAALERGVARVDDDVILVIDHALKMARGHVQHQADAAGHALVEPDVRDGHGQLDVAHAIAADARERHLDAATVADHALVLDALVLAAGALPVPRGTEDALAEETAFFRLEGAVVDGFRVLDFAFGPGTNRIGRRDRNANLIEADAALLTENFANIGISHGIFEC